MKKKNLIIIIAIIALIVIILLARGRKTQGPAVENTETPPPAAGQNVETPAPPVEEETVEDTTIENTEPGGELDAVENEVNEDVNLETETEN